MKLRKLTIEVLIEEDNVGMLKADIFGWDAVIVKNEEVEVDD